MQPESFARWSPGGGWKPAYFIIRPGAERDVEACVRLGVALRAEEDDAWWRTPIRTVRDGQRRALFVADARGQVVGYGRVVCVAADPQVAGAAPAGWYLLGLVVDQAWRRRGIGEELTRARMAWVAERSPRVYYFTGRGNLASQRSINLLDLQEMPGTWIPPGGQPEDARSQQFYCAELHGIT